MNDVFFTFLFFAIGSVAFVVIQAITIAFLIRWNNELRKEVEANKPPF